MATSQQVDDFRASQAGLVAVVQRYLAQFLAAAHSPAEIVDFYVGLIGESGTAAATLAADHYDSLRAEANVPRGYHAAPVPPNADRNAAVARWAASGDQVAVDLDHATQRLVLAPARETIVAAVRNDPERVGYARVPKGDNPCAFCLLLASRGAVYPTKKVAQFRKSDGEKYHNDCHCEPTPIFKGQPLPEGYDPKALYAKYADARKAAKKNGDGGGMKAILSHLREREGIS